MSAQRIDRGVPAETRVAAVRVARRSGFGDNVRLAVILRGPAAWAADAT
jgi:hypothetical protein